MKPLHLLKVGDKVYKDCPSSFGASSTGIQIIKEIIVKYDEDTGDPYNVIVLENGDKYDARDGSSYDLKNCMYYITSRTPELKNVMFKDWECKVILRQYGNGRPAIELVDAEDHMPVAVGSVNIPEAELADDEICIKGWSENEGMERALMEADIIGPVIRHETTGFVQASVHKLLI